jgi:muramoyltetrapeptide carboxypeptidase
MKTPPYLKPGDTIGIVSPAKIIKREIVENAVRLLQKQGFKIKTGAHIFDGDQYFAGTDENRAADFQQMLDDEEVKMILCSRGGYGAVRILDKLDFTKFHQNPKWVAGYSDITVFHSHLNRLGCESLHAEMPLNFPETGQTNSAIDSFLTAAKGAHLSYKIDENPLNRAGFCESEIVGGNLTLLINLLGSPTELKTGGKILFIEDVGEKFYHLDRMMQTMKRAGKLDNLAGLIVGALNDMTESELKFGKTAEEIVAEAVSGFNYPVCFGFPAGHIPDNRALILGRKIKLEVGKTVMIDFLENGIKEIRTLENLIQPQSDSVITLKLIELAGRN